MRTRKASSLKKDFLDRTALIRSIQRVQGNPDCYRRGQVDCDQLDCSWRKHCLPVFHEPHSKNHERQENK